MSVGPALRAAEARILLRILNGGEARETALSEIGPNWEGVIYVIGDY